MFIINNYVNSIMTQPLRASSKVWGLRLIAYTLLSWITMLAFSSGARMSFILLLQNLFSINLVLIIAFGVISLVPIKIEEISINLERIVRFLLSIFYFYIATLYSSQTGLMKNWQEGYLTIGLL